MWSDDIAFLALDALAGPFGIEFPRRIFFPPWAKKSDLSFDEIWFSGFSWIDEFPRHSEKNVAPLFNTILMGFDMIMIGFNMILTLGSYIWIIKIFRIFKVLPNFNVFQNFRLPPIFSDVPFFSGDHIFSNFWVPQNFSTVPIFEYHVFPGLLGTPEFHKCPVLIWLNPHGVNLTSNWLQNEPKAIPKSMCESKYLGSAEQAARPLQ